MSQEKCKFTLKAVTIERRSDEQPWFRAQVLLRMMLKSTQSNEFICSFKEIHHHVLNAGNNYEVFPPLAGLSKIKHKTRSRQSPEGDQLFHTPKAESQAPRINSGPNVRRQTVQQWLFPLLPLNSSRNLLFLQSQFS